MGVAVLYAESRESFFVSLAERSGRPVGELEVLGEIALIQLAEAHRLPRRAMTFGEEQETAVGALECTSPVRVRSREMRLAQERKDRVRAGHYHRLGRQRVRVRGCSARSARARSSCSSFASPWRVVGVGFG